MKTLPLKAENLINTNYPKSQNFDEIMVFSAGFENSSVRGAHRTLEITFSGTITLTLLLVCAFSPRVHSIPRGPH